MFPQVWFYTSISFPITAVSVHHCTCMLGSLIDLFYLVFYQSFCQGAQKRQEPEEKEVADKPAGDGQEKDKDDDDKDKEKEQKTRELDQKQKMARSLGWGAMYSIVFRASFLFLQTFPRVRLHNLMGSLFSCILLSFMQDIMRVN